MLRTNRHDTATLRRRLRSLLTYGLAFAALPLTVGGLGIRADLNADHPAPDLADVQLPPPPAHDPAKKLTAVIVAGTTGAESIDLLAPYEVLATSGAFNVYTVGPPVAHGSILSRSGASGKPGAVQSTSGASS